MNKLINLFLLDCVFLHNCVVNIGFIIVYFSQNVLEMDGIIIIMQHTYPKQFKVKVSTIIYASPLICHNNGDKAIEDKIKQVITPKYKLLSRNDRGI